MRRPVLALLTVVLAALAAGAGLAAPPTAETRLAAVSRDGFDLVDDRGRRLGRSAVVPAVTEQGLVALARRDARGYAIELRPLGAARGRVVARVPGPHLPSLAFSPRGTVLAVGTQTGIVRVTVASGRAVRLPVPAGRHANLVFSPDGAFVYYVRETGDGRAGTLRAELRRAQVAGDRGETLYRVPDPFDERPRVVFATDGDRIVFVRGTSIVSMPPWGGAVDVLVPAAPRVQGLTDPVALPDGAFAFGRTPNRGVADTWLVDADGKLRRLTTTPIPPVGEPRYGTVPLALSPDVTQLLVARRAALAVVPLAGGTPRVVRALPGPALAGYWLP